VIEQLEFEPGVREQIRALWESNRIEARNLGAELAPMQFVALFVADNIMDTD
jgi:hypothetical protein